MRPVQRTRKRIPAGIAGDASGIQTPLTAAALTAGPLALLAVPAIALSAGDQAGSTALQAHAEKPNIRYGRALTVDGRAPLSDAGRAVSLEFAAAGSASWQTLASGSIASNGSFRLAASLRRSGSWKVTSSTAANSTSAPAAGGSGDLTSAEQPVAVAAQLRIPKRQIGVLPGRPVTVAGQLLPGVAGRVVRLQGRDNGGWRTLAGARTDAAGRFRLHSRVRSLGAEALRVTFAGDQLNAHASARAGDIATYRQTLASWYDDSGSTACGFHAYYGVANRDLPCGTKVAFRNGSNTVVAVVDDRGPYVSGRDWDLNQNTARALGFDGVGGVWSAA